MQWEKWTKNRENKILMSRENYPDNWWERYQELRNLKHKFLDFSSTSIWLLVLKKVDEMRIQTTEFRALIPSAAAAAAVFRWLVS